MEKEIVLTQMDVDSINREKLHNFKFGHETLNSKLESCKTLREALHVMQIYLKADVVGAVLVNNQGRKKFLSSHPRSYKAPYDDLSSWIESLKKEDREHINRIITDADAAGSWRELEGDNTVWSTAVVFRLQISPAYFPEGIKCVIILVYEDFAALFVPRRTRMQVSEIAASLNCWFFERDPKGPKRLEDAKDSLNKWFVDFSSALKILGIPEENRDEIWELDINALIETEKAKAKEYESVSDFNTNGTNAVLNHQMLLSPEMVPILSYWAQWAGLNEIQITRLLQQLDDHPDDIRTMLQEKLLNRQTLYERGLISLLTTHWLQESLLQ